MNPEQLVFESHDAMALKPSLAKIAAKSSADNGARPKVNSCEQASVVISTAEAAAGLSGRCEAELCSMISAAGLPLKTTYRVKETEKILNLSRATVIAVYFDGYTDAQFIRKRGDM